MPALASSHLDNPGFDFDKPSRKTGFGSPQAAAPGLPTFTEPGTPATAAQPAFGLALTHFHSFRGNGRELPMPARPGFATAGPIGTG